MFTRFMPKLIVDTVYRIDLDQLKRQGIQGVVTDLDNTLVGAKDPHATPELIEWLAQLKNAGFQVVIVSNNRKERVRVFAEPLGLPFLYRAKKPTSGAFRQALSIMNLKAEQTAVIGDQMVTDILGGNRMGLFTILVNPISPGDESFFTRINRRIERIASSWLRRKGLLKDGPRGRT